MGSEIMLSNSERLVFAAVNCNRFAAVSCNIMVTFLQLCVYIPPSDYPLVVLGKILCRFGG